MPSRRDTLIRQFVSRARPRASINRPNQPARRSDFVSPALERGRRARAGSQRRSYS